MGARLDRALESLSFTPVPPSDAPHDRARELCAAHLDAELPAATTDASAFDPEVLTNGVIGEHVDGGVDFSNLCFTHEWASVRSVSRGLAERERCIHCAAAADEDGGRKRYRELVSRLVLVGR